MNSTPTAKELTSRLLSNHRLNLHSDVRSDRDGGKTAADSRKCAAAESIAGSEPQKIVADLKSWIQDHHVFGHPVFDYLETTAQLPEFRSFLHAELAVEHYFERPPEAGRQAATGPGTDLLRQHVAAQKSTGTQPAQSGFTGTYSTLLERVWVKSGESGMPPVWPASADNGIFYLAGIDRRHDDFDFSVITSLLDAIKSFHCHKIFNGCSRIGIISGEFNGETIPANTEKLFDAALQPLLTSPSHIAIDKVKQIVFFMDWTVDHYDRIFNDILWSQ